jgi:hypothetical protein
VLVGVAEVELGGRVALLRGQLEISGGLLVVLLDARALEVQAADAELGEFVAAVGKRLPDAQRLGVVAGQVCAFSGVVVFLGR